MTDDREGEVFQACNRLFISVIFLWFSLTLQSVMQWRHQCNVCEGSTLCVSPPVCDIFTLLHRQCRV